MLRKEFLRQSALASVWGLMGCNVVTTTTTNGTTKVTINVASVDKYGQAFKIGVQTFLGFPGVSTLLGSYLEPFAAIVATVTTDLAAFDNAAAGQVEFDITTSSALTLVTSILAAGQKALALVQTALPQTAIIGTILNWLNAMQTIVELFMALLPGIAGAKVRDGVLATVAPMEEKQALAVLGAV